MQVSLDENELNPQESTTCFSWVECLSASYWTPIGMWVLKENFSIFKVLDDILQLKIALPMTALMGDPEKRYKEKVQFTNVDIILYQTWLCWLVIDIIWYQQQRTKSSTLERTDLIKNVSIHKTIEDEVDISWWTN